MGKRLFWFFVSGILYTYFGYPILLSIFTRKKEKPAPVQSLQPEVSLIVAAYNEEAVITNKLQNCLSLHYPLERLQIIVAADGSDDGTVAIVKKFIETHKGNLPQIVLSYVPERKGKMAAINHAMQQATGEIVVFSDANNYYGPDTLSELITPFGNPEVGAVSGSKRILSEGESLGESEGLYWKYESYIKEKETLLGSCTSAQGEVLAMRRNLYQAPPSDIINDDFYLGMQVIRQGKRLVYAPRAWSYEQVSLTAQDEINRRERIVAGRYQAIMLAGKILPWNNLLVVWQVISHKFMRPLVPLAMIGAFVANLLAIIKPNRKGKNRFFSMMPPFNYIFLGIQMLFYGLAWIGSKIKMEGKIGRILYLPTFLVNSNLAALNGLIHYLKGQQTVTWKRVQRREENHNLLERGLLP